MKQQEMETRTSRHHVKQTFQHVSPQQRILKIKYSCEYQENIMHIFGPIQPNWTLTLQIENYSTRGGRYT